MRTVSLFFSLMIWTSATLATGHSQSDPGLFPGAGTSASPSESVLVDGRVHTFFLAENSEDNNHRDNPEPGSLVIPGEEKSESEKKCLNVCKQWGEDCIINPRTGARNCRRTCKEFGMECF